jgi:hypothetical protein
MLKNPFKDKYGKIVDEDIQDGSKECVKLKIKGSGVL